MSAQANPQDDAQVIQYAFGTNANLYSDVLSVPPDAQQKQIQSAFFDRRYEMYEILKKENELTPTEQHFAQRRMEAIIAAYRILSDPSARAEYDEILAGAVGPPATAKETPRRDRGKAAPKSDNLASPSKLGRSKSLLKKALHVSPLSRSRSRVKRSKSSSDLLSTKDGRIPSPSPALDDGEIRLQKQLLQQSNGQVPTQELNGRGQVPTQELKGRGQVPTQELNGRGRRLSAHLDSHSRRSPSNPSRKDDQTISTLGMSGVTTPNRPVSILKNKGSDETDRTRPVESDNDGEDDYDFHEAYAKHGQQGNSQESPAHQSHRSKSNRSRRRSSRRKYESETDNEDETTVAEDEENRRRHHHRRSQSGKKKTAVPRTYDDIASFGCSALAPMDFLFKPGRVFRACKEEITGAAADTTSAFDQVCNVFTIRGSELNAVFGEIDVAKRELSPKKKSAKSVRTDAALKKSGPSKIGISKDSKSTRRVRKSIRQ